MKLRLLTLAIALGAIALAGAAVAGTEQSAGKLTIAHSWQIGHDSLLRQFSQGLGFDLPDRSTVVASAGPYRGEQAHEHGVEAKRANAKPRG